MPPSFLIVDTAEVDLLPLQAVFRHPGQIEGRGQQHHAQVRCLNMGMSKGQGFLQGKHLGFHRSGHCHQQQIFLPFIIGNLIVAHYDPFDGIVISPSHQHLAMNQAVINPHNQRLLRHGNLL